jgi:hypothetical protein
MAKIINYPKHNLTKAQVAALVDTYAGIIYLRGTTFPADGNIPEGVTDVSDFKRIISEVGREATAMNKANRTNVYQEYVFDIWVQKTSKGPKIKTRVYHRNKLVGMCQGLPRYQNQATKQPAPIKVSDTLRETLAANFIVWDTTRPCTWLPIVDEVALTRELQSLGDYF